VLQIHVTQPPGDILVFLTGQVSAVVRKGMVYPGKYRAVVWASVTLGLLVLSHSHI
jgi:hypothetical protein